jgi:hypothetical protein
MYHTTKNMLFSCGFCCRKKSAGIPKEFPADFALRSHYLRICDFQENPQVFLRIFLRFSPLKIISCGSDVFRKIYRYS